MSRVDLSTDPAESTRTRVTTQVPGRRVAGSSATSVEVRAMTSPFPIFFPRLRESGLLIPALRTGRKTDPTPRRVAISDASPTPKGPPRYIHPPSSPTTRSPLPPFRNRALPRVPDSRRGLRQRSRRRPLAGDRPPAPRRRGRAAAALASARRDVRRGRAARPPPHPEAAPEDPPAQAARLRARVEKTNILRLGIRHLPG